MKRILVAIDGSEPSQRAATLAGELTGKYDGELVAINVMPEGQTPDDEVLAFARAVLSSAASRMSADSRSGELRRLRLFLPRRPSPCTTMTGRSGRSGSFRTA